MKLTCLLVAAICLFSAPVMAAPKARRIDPVTMPITVPELERGIRASTHDADAMVTYLLRGEVCELGIPAFNTLKTLKAAQPKNAVVLGAYGFAFYIATHCYNSHQPRTPELDPSPEMVKEWEETLLKAYKLDKMCYIAPVVHALSMVWMEGKNVSPTRQGGLRLLKRECERHPNNSWLLEEFGCAALFVAEQKPCPEGLAALQKAVALDPPNSFAALHLCSHWLGTDERRFEKWRGVYLSLLDPNYPIPPDLRKPLHLK